MQVVCPRCGQSIAGSDIDLARGQALCRACSELFALPAVGAVAPMPFTPLAPVAPDAIAPHRPADLRWTERIDGKEAAMTLTPSRLPALPLLGFAAAWDAFLVFWYGIAFASKNAPWLMFVFPLLHVGVGVFITWQGLVRLLNVSRFAFDAARFTVSSGPVPQRGAREAVTNVDRFDVAEARGRRTTSWQVRMLTKDGRAVTLALPLDAYAHASFVAARLNAALDAVRAPTTYRG